MDRALSVLDGAVLVVSAVEGVQAQTRVLMRALQRLGIPALIFVNKIDRSGADGEAVLWSIAARLTRSIMPMGTVRGLGTREAEFLPGSAADADFQLGAAADAAFTERLAGLLAERDDALLAAYVAGAAIPHAGLRVDPAAAGSGVAFRLEIELGALPLAFLRAVEETVRATLRQGIYGWQVTDVVVTMTDSGYWPRQSHAHAHFGKTMSSTGADFRGLTPLVLMDALKQAGSGVYEPVQRFRLELPALARLRAVPGAPAIHGAQCVLEGEIRAARVRELEQQLPGLTGGEGLLECVFDHYERIRGDQVPSRPRSDHNPLHRQEYLRHVSR